MPEEVATLIVITHKDHAHKGMIHSILGSDGPIPYLAIEVDTTSTSPYRIQAVIPRREYHLAGVAGAPLIAALEDLAAVKPFMSPGDVKVNDKVLYRNADKVWQKEEFRVTQIIERFECVLRNNEGDTCSTLLDHDIQALMPPKTGKKPKKGAIQAGRPRKSASTPAATPAPSSEPASTFAATQTTQPDKAVATS
ncbi:MAG: hypothetical protein ACYDEV_10690 [Acidiferrobacter sp.]